MNFIYYLTLIANLVSLISFRSYLSFLFFIEPLIVKFMTFLGILPYMLLQIYYQTEMISVVISKYFSRDLISRCSLETFQAFLDFFFVFIKSNFYNSSNSKEDQMLSVKMPLIFELTILVDKLYFFKIIWDQFQSLLWTLKYIIINCNKTSDVISFATRGLIKVGQLYQLY